MSESQIKQINPVRYLIKRVNYIKEQLSNGVNMITQINNQPCNSPLCVGLWDREEPVPTCREGSDGRWAAGG
jgi:hypothetical protein